MGDVTALRRLDRYLLSQCLALFGFFALVFVSVYWVNRAVILFDRLIGDGQTALVFLEFTALSLPNVVRLVLPIAAFAAAVALTNRLANDSELVVAQATGVSIWKLARPILIFGVLVGAMMAVLVHVLVPNARGQLAQREAEVAADVSARILKEGQFVHPSPGITVYLRQITPEGELLDVFLTDARATDRQVTYLASRAYLVREDNRPKLVMFDGTAQTLDLRTGRLFVTAFEDFSYDIGELIVGGTRVGRDMRELPTPVLLRAGEVAQAVTGRTASDLRREGHSRIVQPVRPVVTALIGFAALMIGGFSRFGVWRQVILAIALLIVIQILENAALSAADRLDAVWPIYLPPVIGIVLAYALLWMSERPGLMRRMRRRAPPAGHDPGLPQGAAT